MVGTDDDDDACPLLLGTAGKRKAWKGTSVGGDQNTLAGQLMKNSVVDVHYCHRSLNAAACRPSGKRSVLLALARALDIFRLKERKFK